MRLPARKAGLPIKIKEISVILCPLIPAYEAGIAGHVPAKIGR
jgi:hypothetical protein